MSWLSDLFSAPARVVALQKQLSDNAVLLTNSRDNLVACENEKATILSLNATMIKQIEDYNQIAGESLFIFTDGTLANTYLKCQSKLYRVANMQVNILTWPMSLKTSASESWARWAPLKVLVKTYHLSRP